MWRAPLWRIPSKWRAPTCSRRSGAKWPFVTWTPSESRVALADLADARLIRHPAAPLDAGIWSLRDTHSACDAAYVALPEALALPLVATDGRVTRSHGHAAEIIHVWAEETLRSVCAVFRATALPTARSSPS